MFALSVAVLFVLPLTREVPHFIVMAHGGLLWTDKGLGKLKWFHGSFPVNENIFPDNLNKLKSKKHRSISGGLFFIRCDRSFNPTRNAHLKCEADPIIWTTVAAGAFDKENACKGVNVCCALAGTNTPRLP